MSNQYVYNSYQPYSPNMVQSSINTGNNGVNGIDNSTSPLFNNLTYIQAQNPINTNSLSTSSGSLSASSASSTSSSATSASSGFGQQGASNYSFHTPRLRYYLSKSFDIEDDLEFCPEIPENYSSSPSNKKFNPYTASVFSPSQIGRSSPPAASAMLYGQNQNGNATQPFNLSPRVHTPRIKKPLEIINPQTKLRVGSPATHR